MTTETDVTRFERRLGTAWLNRAGAVLLILGAGFLVKYAAERDWLGPFAWVTIGFATGLALILTGHAVAARYRVPAQGLLGVDIVTLYLSAYAANVVYGLVGHMPAFSPRPTPRIRNAFPSARPVEVWVNLPKTRATEAAFCTTTREPAVSFHAGSAILDPQRISG